MTDETRTPLPEIQPLDGEACERIYVEAKMSARGENPVEADYRIHQAALVNVYAAGQRSVTLLKNAQQDGPSGAWRCPTCSATCIPHQAKPEAGAERAPAMHMSKDGEAVTHEQWLWATDRTKEWYSIPLYATDRREG